jgi:hypothetical protein
MQLSGIFLDRKPEGENKYHLSVFSQPGEAGKNSHKGTKTQTINVYYN